MPSMELEINGNGNTSNSWQELNKHGKDKIIGNDFWRSVDLSSGYNQAKLHLTSDVVSMLFRPTSVALELTADLNRSGIGIGPGM